MAPRRVSLLRCDVGPATRSGFPRHGVRRLHVAGRGRRRPLSEHVEVRRVRPRRASVASAFVDSKRNVHGRRGGRDATTPTPFINELQHRSRCAEPNAATCTRGFEAVKQRR